MPIAITLFAEFYYAITVWTKHGLSCLIKVKLKVNNSRYCACALGSSFTFFIDTGIWLK